MEKDKAYYVDRDGTRIYYDDIATRIRKEFPELIGEHIFAQLNALGLREGFNGGRTPCALPYTFI